MSKPNRTTRQIKPTILREWRERMGYSQNDAAKAVGSSLTAWKAWEGGSMRIPLYIGLALAALALGMSPYGVPSEAEAGKDD